MVELPLNDGTVFSPTEEQLQEFKNLYPAVDVDQQMRAMRGWIMGSPRNKKTRSGILRFINTWLAKEQNRAPPKAPTLSTPADTDLATLIRSCMSDLGYRVTDGGVWAAVIGSSWTAQEVQQAFIGHARAGDTRPTPYTILDRLRGRRETPKATAFPAISLHGTSARTLAMRLWRDKGFELARAEMEAAYPGSGFMFMDELRQAGVQPDYEPKPALSNIVLPGYVNKRAAMAMREPGADDDA